MSLTYSGGDPTKMDGKQKKAALQAAGRRKASSGCCSSCVPESPMQYLA